MIKNIYIVIIIISGIIFGLRVNAQVVINEIMYDLKGSDEDREWVEIYNNSGESVDLTGWKFNDGSNHILNIPPQNSGQGSIILNAGSYAILADNAAVFLSEHQGFSGTVIDSSFSLKNTGAVLKIINKNKAEVDNVSYSSSLGGKENGKTLERQSDGLLKESLNIGGTPGAANSAVSALPSPQPSFAPEPTPVFTPIPLPTPLSAPPPTPLSSLSPLPTAIPTSTPSSFPAPEIIESPPPSFSQTGNEAQTNASFAANTYGRLLITEFIPSPKGPDEENEWIEIYNPEQKEISLKSWRIQDAQEKEFIFKDDKIIKSGEYLVLPRSLTKITLNNDGESLYLINPEGENVFKITQNGKAPEGMSFARFGDKKWSWTSKITPGAENILVEKNSNIASDKTNGNNAQKSLKEETTFDLRGQIGDDDAAGQTENYKKFGLLGNIGPWGIALFISVVFAALSAIFIRKIGF